MVLQNVGSVAVVLRQMGLFDEHFMFPPHVVAAFCALCCVVRPSRRNLLF